MRGHEVEAEVQRTLHVACRSAWYSLVLPPTKPILVLSNAFAQPQSWPRLFKANAAMKTWAYPSSAGSVLGMDEWENTINIIIAAICHALRVLSSSTRLTSFDHGCSLAKDLLRSTQFRLHAGGTDFTWSDN